MFFFVGTRYFIRGLDAEGNAANYVETEQIAQFESGACSFIQVNIVTDWGSRKATSKSIYNIATRAAQSNSVYVHCKRAS